MTKRIPKAARMTPRAHAEPTTQPYVRPLLSQLLLLRAEWWFVTDDLSTPHITASAHMLSLSHDPLYKTHSVTWIGDWFVYSSWLCLFEANFQLTDGEG